MNVIGYNTLFQAKCSSIKKHNESGVDVLSDGFMAFALYHDRIVESSQCADKKAYVVAARPKVRLSTFLSTSLAESDTAS